MDTAGSACPESMGSGALRAAAQTLLGVLCMSLPQWVRALGDLCRENF